MEQEAGSTAKYILTAVGNGVQPYYRNLPENFQYPSVFFPVPDVTTGSDTFSTYRSDYSLFITFFHGSKQEAYELALTALTAIKKNRNLVPLLDETGKQIGKRFLRLKDPEIRCTSENTATLVIRYTTRKKYNDARGVKVTDYYLNTYLK